jgi:hypothetical protein
LIHSPLQGAGLPLECRFQFTHREAKHQRIGRYDGDFGSLERCGARKQRDGQQRETDEVGFHG